MKLAVVGSRKFSDYNIAKEKIQDHFDINKITDIVSGGAKGADYLGQLFAQEFNKNMIAFLPDWKRYGKAAGVIRNKLIVENSDAVIAFWDGVSKGTKKTIDIAAKLNKKLVVITI